MVARNSIPTQTTKTDPTKRNTEQRIKRNDNRHVHNDHYLHNKHQQQQTTLTMIMSLSASGLLSRSTAAAFKSTWAKSTSSRFMSSSVVTLSDSDAVAKFGKIHSKSVLYFTASWCGPCRAIGPVYDDLSAKYKEDGIGFGKVDVDENGDAAAQFRIQAVPTFFFCEGEEPYFQMSGADTAKLQELVGELKDR